MKQQTLGGIEKYGETTFRFLNTFAGALLVLDGVAPAFASRYRGADRRILFVFYALPFALIPIVQSLLIVALRAFRRPAIYRAFMFVATVVAAFFLLIAFRAPGGFASSPIAIIEILVVLALTLTPPWLQQRRAQREADLVSVSP